MCECVCVSLQEKDRHMIDLREREREVTRTRLHRMMYDLEIIQRRGNGTGFYKVIVIFLNLLERSIRHRRKPPVYMCVCVCVNVCMCVCENTYG